MLRIYKQITGIAFFITITVSAFGQSTNSPYSMYGVGEMGDTDFGRSKAMGGVATPLYSPFHLNPENPASYTALGMNSFILEIGATAKYLSLRAEDISYDEFNGNFSYLAIGFPITKWLKSGLGLMPLTSIGYDVMQQSEDEYDGNMVITNYRGEGGITNFYFDNSVQILKSLSVGFKLSYLFGPLLKNTISTSFNDNSSTSINRQDKANVSSFAYRGGLHFHKKLSEKIYTNIGVSYGFNSDLEATNRLFITNTVSRTNGSFVDTIADQVINVGVLEIPQSYSVGATVLIDRKIELGVDYSMSMWSTSNYFDDDPNFADAEKFAFGAEYIPEYSSLSFAKIVRYRVGTNFSKSYLTYEGEQLESYGFSFGLGIPLKRTQSVMNFAFGYKKRYLPSIEALTEHHYTFQLNMSLHAVWFKKRVWE